MQQNDLNQMQTDPNLFNQQQVEMLQAAQMTQPGAVQQQQQQAFTTNQMQNVDPSVFNQQQQVEMLQAAQMSQAGNANQVQQFNTTDLFNAIQSLRADFA